MILDSDTPIDLGRLRKAMAIFVDLQYATLAEGETVLDDQDRLDGIANEFIEGLESEAELEVPVRNAIVFLLNLPPDRFDEIAWQADPPLPRRGNAEEYRGLLEYLWDRVWATWRVPDFAPEDFDVVRR